MLTTTDYSNKSLQHCKKYYMHRKIKWTSKNDQNNDQNTFTRTTNSEDLQCVKSVASRCIYKNTNNNKHSNKKLVFSWFNSIRHGLFVCIHSVHLDNFLSLSLSIILSLSHFHTVEYELEINCVYFSQKAIWYMIDWLGFQ